MSKKDIEKKALMTTRTVPFVPPKDAGLYAADQERDACGVGFIANLRGLPQRETVRDALQMLEVCSRQQQQHGFRRHVIQHAS